jgi:hypothetical protein
MLFKLSHKQREALCAAADRADRLFPSPPHLKVGEAKKLAAKLVAVGAGQGSQSKAWGADLASRRDRAGMRPEVDGRRRERGRGRRKESIGNGRGGSGHAVRDGRTTEIRL